MEASVNSPKIYTPDPAVLGSWSSQLNGNNPDFDGTDAFEGVNPANGVVIYYHLPESVSDSTEVILEIKNQEGKLVRTITSKKDENFQSYDGGPSPEPNLSVEKGLNRFVWDMRNIGMPGIPTAYIEAGYSGHQVSPGNYMITLKSGDSESSTTAEILINPLYDITMADYETYDKFMSAREAELTEMHKMVNTAKSYQDQLASLMKKTKGNPNFELINQEGEALMKALKIWDEKMVQRRSKAYDDVENFPNKFTANYLFMINQTQSAIPKVNQGSIDRYNELWAEWEILKTEGDKLLEESIPNFNKLAKDQDIGPLFQ